MILFLIFLIENVESKPEIINTNHSEKIKISFGSCNNFNHYPDSTTFSKVAEYDPDIFIWLGDVAYLDDHISIFHSRLPNLTRVEQKFMQTKLNVHYQKLYNKPGRKIIGVWDDHDYGKNDGDKHNSHKEDVRKLYLNFLDEPIDSTRRKNPAGIYTSYYIKPSEAEVFIKIILLDVRFNKDKLTEDILGEDQWLWLENELLIDNEAIITIIGSGTQVMPNDRILPEYWFPKSRERLYGLISQREGVFLISGDVHFGEIMSEPEWCRYFGYPLYELTSSGLTHTLATNIYLAQSMLNGIVPDYFNTKDERLLDYNFGVIEINLNQKDPLSSSLEFQIRNSQGQVKIHKEIVLRNLQKQSCDEISIPNRYLRWFFNLVVKGLSFNQFLWTCLLILLGFLYFSILFKFRKAFICIFFLTFLLKAFPIPFKKTILTILCFIYFVYVYKSKKNK